MSDLIVYKDNYLIEASYKLTLIEQRLMIYCISKLNPQNPTIDQEIIIDDFVKQFKDIDIKNAYKQVKQAIEHLYERSIKVKDPKQVTEFRWISAKRYYSDDGKALISFSPQVLSYLFQLEKQFTKYQLRNISAFKRTYSIRLYELLTQYRNIKSRIISVLDLRESLQLESKFPKWFEFKRNVMDSSIKEINEKSDLLIEYQLIKKGRSIDSIKFLIKEKNKIKLVKSDNSNKLNSERKGLKSTNELVPEVQKYLDEIKANLNKD